MSTPQTATLDEAVISSLEGLDLSINPAENPMLYLNMITEVKNRFPNYIHDAINSPRLMEFLQVSGQHFVKAVVSKIQDNEDPTEETYRYYFGRHLLTTFYLGLIVGLTMAG